MHDSDADTFAEMALSLHGESTLQDTVERVLEYACKAVDATYAGIVFVHRKQRVETVMASEPLVESMDQLQMAYAEGPDVDVAPDRYSVLVSDTQLELRWPRWAKGLAELGVRSMLGTRLYTSATTIGSLNLYDPTPDHFSVEDQEVAHLLARHAAVALDHAQESENLWKAIDARKLIGQAQGILMERYDLDAEQAFAVLRRYSQDHNVKLNEVARRLIATRKLPR